MFYHDLVLLGTKGLAMKTQPLATKLPADLTEQLDSVCKRLGLRKNYVIETALRDKIEDLLDAADLGTAIKEATGFHAWEEVKRKNNPKRGRRGV